ncbi:hypothetical protein CPB83DRAFT_526759 [Crepidotus variabilis]|uniref:Secreted protein n=1 Tax=Crepidotus variabilis TaxID=179855 RepID=A0A9P6EQX6_9AGAR|nr:hypothetical protein CPB83DRAFT_526759 [Crepidotus variabilis]
MIVCVTLICWVSCLKAIYGHNERYPRLGTAHEDSQRHVHRALLPVNSCLQPVEEALLQPLCKAQYPWKYRCLTLLSLNV